MRKIHLPRPDGFGYWVPLFIASILGTNLGDLYAHESGLGIVAGLSLLALVFTIVVWRQSTDATPRTAYYWAAILLIRTGATNIADFSAHRLHIPMELLAAALAVALSVLAMRARVRSDAQMDTGPLYWSAMLVAGTFGTVAGDAVSDRFTVEVAASALAMLWIVSISFAPHRALATTAGYWLAVALTRTAGTAMGDWLAEGKPLELGLPVATAISLTTFLVALVCVAERSPADPRNAEACR